MRELASKYQDHTWHAEVVNEQSFQWLVKLFVLMQSYHTSIFQTDIMHCLTNFGIYKYVNSGVNNTHIEHKYVIQAILQDDMRKYWNSMFVAEFEFASRDLTSLTSFEDLRGVFDMSEVVSKAKHCVDEEIPKDKENRSSKGLNYGSLEMGGDMLNAKEAPLILLDIYTLWGGSYYNHMHESEYKTVLSSELATTYEVADAVAVQMVTGKYHTQMPTTYRLALGHFEMVVIGFTEQWLTKRGKYGTASPIINLMKVGKWDRKLTDDLFYHWVTPRTFTRKWSWNNYLIFAGIMEQEKMLSRIRDMFRMDPTGGMNLGEAYDWFVNLVKTAKSANLKEWSEKAELMPLARVLQLFLRYETEKLTGIEQYEECMRTIFEFNQKCLRAALKTADADTTEDADETADADETEDADTTEWILPKLSDNPAETQLRVFTLSEAIENKV